MRRRDFLKAGIGSAAALALGRISARGGTEKRMLRLRYFTPQNGKMLPANRDSLQRIFLMDVDYNPLPVRSHIVEDGLLEVEEPNQKFKISATDWVGAFGFMGLVADDGGAGYAPATLDQEVDLNREIARSRINGVAAAGAAMASPPPEAALRLDKASAAQTAAGRADEPEERAVRAWEALEEAMWAGETVALEKARHAISRRGRRKGYLFGCNAFGAISQGEPYTRHFYDIFNYCTLPFYYSGFEPEPGKPTWRRLDQMVDWCKEGKIRPKGHPLLWMHPAGVPNWLEDKSFDNVRRLHVERIRSIVQRYKGRIDYWDVINEAHDFANSLNFTYEQFLDLTDMCCRETRAANPDCTSVVNSTSMWAEYAAVKPDAAVPAVMRRTPHQYVADCVRKDLDFDVIGVQMYYPNRDMFEIDRMLERFGRFGKPVHITEHAISSSPEADEKAIVKQPGGFWHSQLSQTVQADFIEAFWTLAYSKEFVTAITYWDFSDAGGHFWGRGGFLDADLKPKESYSRLQKLIRGWQSA